MTRTEQAFDILPDIAVNRFCFIYFHLLEFQKKSFDKCLNFFRNHFNFLKLSLIDIERSASSGNFFSIQAVKILQKNLFHISATAPIRIFFLKTTSSLVS